MISPRGLRAHLMETERYDHVIERIDIVKMQKKSFLAIFSKALPSQVYAVKVSVMVEVPSSEHQYAIGQRQSASWHDS